LALVAPASLNPLPAEIYRSLAESNQCLIGLARTDRWR